MNAITGWVIVVILFIVGLVFLNYVFFWKYNLTTTGRDAQNRENEEFPFLQQHELKTSEAPVPIEKKSKTQIDLLNRADFTEATLSFGSGASSSTVSSKTILFSPESKRAVLFLQGLASPKGMTGEMEPPKDWQQIDKTQQEKTIQAINEGAGHYSVDQLFWLLYSVATLDINVFAPPFYCGVALLQNLNSHKDQLDARKFPVLIWALAIFLRMYATDNPELRELLITTINLRLLALADKIESLENSNHLILNLLQTRLFLAPFADKIAWPHPITDFLEYHDDVVGEENPSGFEKSVVNSLREFWPRIRFETSYLIPGTKHRADIALPEYKTVVEVDGIPHYYAGSQRTTMKTRMRDLLLETLGWRVIRVNCFEWEKAQKMARKKMYLQATVIDKLTPKNPSATIVPDRNFMRPR